MTNICFLKEEQEQVISTVKLDNYNFVSTYDLSTLKCNILFVFNKNYLKYFIKDISYETHNLFETENIDFIVINDLNIFSLIKNNYESIIDIKVEESWLNG